MKTNDSRSKPRSANVTLQYLLHHLCAVENTLNLFKRTCDDLLQQNARIYDSFMNQEVEMPRMK